MGTKWFGCYFYNFDFTDWFSTEEAARRHGELSGYQYTVVEKTVY